MDRRDNISKELTELFPTLAKVPRFTVYSVPEGYFEYLDTAIMQKVLTSQKEDLNSAKPNPYSLSSEYFQQLPSNILNRIKENLSQSYSGESGELKDVAPFVERINRITPYQIPAGYFEKVPETISVSLKSRGKLIPILRKFKPFQYAAAAVIIAILATGILYFSGGNSTRSFKQDTDVQGVAGFNPNDLHFLSEGEIAEFLQTPGIPEDVSSFPATISGDEPVEAHIKSVPDSDIQQYLKENPEPGT